MLPPGAHRPGPEDGRPSASARGAGRLVAPARAARATGVGRPDPADGASTSVPMAISTSGAEEDAAKVTGRRWHPPDDRARPIGPWCRSGRQLLDGDDVQ